ncbi:MAG: peptidase [Ramlibacter sp.]|jgi:dipeptidyl aminopeptidase/acylaminoacyl peptidase|uniref:S9 family peptidase n=1 Tax=Ramlibacter sp. TaxID=1917967 RepID=UPI00262D337D|nr:S9 family peptidase [Ramlibacter sp.]MDB5751408.1 peptidase [Ramlibacter sp.]
MTNPFTPQDLYLHRKVTEVACAPDGSWIAAAVRSIRRQEDDAISNIWAVSPSGDPARQLTFGTGTENAPRWSPDSTQLAFISNRGGTNQVYVLPLAGGEARQVGGFEGAVSDLRWMPDGRSLVVACAVSVDPDWRGARPAGRKPKTAGVQPQVAWKLPYKSDGVGYTLKREIHLFLLELGSGEQRQLTDGAFDVLAFDISPDGRELAYTRTRSGRFGHRCDLWLAGVDGSGARQCTRDFATVMSPAWSPDGGRVAFCATGEEGDAQTGLHVLDVAGGRSRRLGDENLQVSDPLSVRWGEDGRHLLCTLQSRGRHQVARVPVDGGDAKVLCAGDRQFSAFSAGGGLLAYAVDHPSLPSEVHLCDCDGGVERQVSDFNPWWKDRTSILAESWQFEVPDGKGGTETIEGWLLRAEGAVGPMPLLNDVHGGPAAYALLDFDTNVFWQVLCSKGWAVLALNAVGSASYGREFCDRLSGHWGEYDLPQHLSAIRQLKKEGICDERIAVAGKSYGGYLSAWSIGHCAQFRAAVVMAPVGNIETHYGTSDGGYYADPYYMGTRDRFQRELARQLSPLHCVEKATTPTLFMQGADDERCPKCQSEELFVSLMRAGDTPTELVLYPEQDHHFLGEGAPSVREDAATRIVDWLVAHIDREPQPLRQEDDTATAQST